MEGRPLDKQDFQEHTRYAVTRRDESGKLRPDTIYVYRMYDEFMIVRRTNSDGRLLKLAYEDVVKIVKTIPVAKEDRFYIPDAVLEEKTWKDRTVMERYSSSPHMGK